MLNFLEFSASNGTKYFIIPSQITYFSYALPQADTKFGRFSIFLVGGESIDFHGSKDSKIAYEKMLEYVKTVK